MKVGVVGGNGNIGYSVARELVRLGHEVVCFHRGLSGPVPEGARSIFGDRRDRDRFERSMQAERFDAVVDMTSYNAADAQSAVRAFAGVSHFVQCSSVATYGRGFDVLPTGEDHPARGWTDSAYGLNKHLADVELMRAQAEVGFPVTFLKPSITFRSTQGLLRQLGNDMSWLDRVRQGLPIVVADDGGAVHQHMHSDDAGRAFALVVGREKCIGKTYNLVHEPAISWREYHETAMVALGRQVPIVGVPAAVLQHWSLRGDVTFSDVFCHDSWFSGGKLRADIPELPAATPLVDAMRSVYAELDQQGRIPAAERGGWEDQLVARYLTRPSPSCVARRAFPRVLAAVGG